MNEDDWMYNDETKGRPVERPHSPVWGTDMVEPPKESVRESQDRVVE